MLICNEEACPLIGMPLYRSTVRSNWYSHDQEGETSVQCKCDDIKTPHLMYPVPGYRSWYTHFKGGIIKNANGDIFEPGAGISIIEIQNLTGEKLVYTITTGSQYYPHDISVDWEGDRNMVNPAYVNNIIQLDVDNTAYDIRKQHNAIKHIVAKTKLINTSDDCNTDTLKIHQQIVTNSIHPLSLIRRLVIAYKTGSGKSAIMSKCIDQFFYSGRRTLIIVPTLELKNNIIGQIGTHSTYYMNERTQPSVQMVDIRNDTFVRNDRKMDELADIPYKKPLSGSKYPQAVMKDDHKHTGPFMIRTFSEMKSHIRQHATLLTGTTGFSGNDGAFSIDDGICIIDEAHILFHEEHTELANFLQKRVPSMHSCLLFTATPFETYGDALSQVTRLRNFLHFPESNDNLREFTRNCIMWYDNGTSKNELFAAEELNAKVFESDDPSYYWSSIRADKMKKEYCTWAESTYMPFFTSNNYELMEMTKIESILTTANDGKGTTTHQNNNETYLRYTINNPGEMLPSCKHFLDACLENMKTRRVFVMSIIQGFYVLPILLEKHNIPYCVIGGAKNTNNETFDIYVKHGYRSISTSCSDRVRDILTKQNTGRRNVTTDNITYTTKSILNMYNDVLDDTPPILIIERTFATGIEVADVNYIYINTNSDYTPTEVVQIKGRINRMCKKTIKDTSKKVCIYTQGNIVRQYDAYQNQRTLLCKQSIVCNNEITNFSDIHL
jgi:hypothetical protein